MIHNSYLLLLLHRQKIGSTNFHTKKKTKIHISFTENVFANFCDKNVAFYNYIKMGSAIEELQIYHVDSKSLLL